MEQIFIGFLLFFFLIVAQNEGTISNNALEIKKAPGFILIPIILGPVQTRLFFTLSTITTTMFSKHCEADGKPVLLVYVSPHN